MKVVERFLNTQKFKMVGLVGYAPTTFRMSSEHSTIELKAHFSFNIKYFYIIFKKKKKKIDI